jgi:hypothetical protein
MAVRAGGCIL